MEAEQATAVNRIFIVGGMGTGKTTLAKQISHATGLPIHDLDEIARVGGGTGPERSAEDRADAVEAIVRSDRWVVEGIHLDWTDALLAAADKIVWLDHISARRSSGRMVKRFAQQAIAEMRQRRGREKFLRVRDYARNVRDLVGAIPERLRYQHAGGESSTGLETRSATEAVLAPYEAKVIHCQTQADVTEVAATLMPRP